MSGADTRRLADRAPWPLIVGGMAVAGVLLGALWALLAPPLRRAYGLTTRGDRVMVFLGEESEHYFDSAALLVCLLTGLAVVATVAIWQWRRHRGPRMVAFVTVGAAVASGAAAAVGAGLVRLRYGAPDLASAPLSPDDRIVEFTQAPAVFFGTAPLQALVTAALPVLAAALTLAVCVALTARDDLGVAGGQPAPEPPAPPMPVLEGPALDPTPGGDLRGDPH
ncbi:DUF2567 domain-containing protein [Mycobacterium sp. MYCO198283]|uniref:DUF2567 domain-containing protein n=1 Tax=Mycobacterium sp. MYCO198283 TaxID=2883505 RepID=UPI001E3A8776|nr:DUF2567 domain-containing protein [Mycobacterium sp. MYCO198283]MCG5433517.1 DUF2567 domain-containing protein [Mycobacterium sp. MYCO198283]